MKRYAGKWVVIDAKAARILAVGETLKEIAPLVTRSVKDKRKAHEVPSAFKVPRKGEGPYVLQISLH